MSDKSKHEKLNETLVQSLNDLLEKGDWDATLFLKANKKRIEALRDRAKTLLEQAQALKSAETITAPRTLEENECVVFVSLYQADSNNLNKWQSVIKGLERHSVSRPVYREEAHIKNFIRHKVDPQREAYVVVHINQLDIAKPYLGKAVKDRFNNELITLKEKAIKLENVLEFVHNGKRYALTNGHIVEV